MSSAKLTLWNGKINKSGESPIVIQYIHNRKVSRVLTGVSIRPEFWDKNNFKIKKSHLDSVELNTTILNKLSDVQQTINSLKRKNIEPTFQAIQANLNKPKMEAVLQNVLNEMWKNGDLKNQLKLSIDKEEVVEEVKKEDNTALKYWKEFIQDIQRFRTEGTMKGYVVAYNYFKKFNSKLSFEDINESVYKDFIYYLTKKGITNNTIGAQIKRLKTYFNWCNDKGYSNITHLKKWKPLNEKTTLIALNRDEFKRIETVELNSEAQRMVRDCFVFAVYTFLRHSDLYQLSVSNYRNGRLYLTTKKTKEVNNIQLPPQCIEIIERYRGKTRNNKLLPVISNQKMNDMLKIIGEKAGINDSTQIVRYIGNQRKEIELPKYEFITCHTARRTGITLALQLGVNQEVVMSQSTHRDYKTFQIYIKHSQQEKDKQMNEGWSRL